MKVKVLYDFEAVEDNELSFKTGDIINILDDSDPNWWKGEGDNGEGLFPSNFVTSDFSEQAETNEVSETEEQITKFSNEVHEPVLKVNEELLNETLDILQSTDPETSSSDSAELLQNEERCAEMGKLIDNQLKDVDKQHLELTLLNEKILESLKLYDKLMNETRAYSHPASGLPMQYSAYSTPQHADLVLSSTYNTQSAVFTPAINPNFQYHQASHLPSMPPVAVPGQHNAFPTQSQYR